ncbi:hypothetical protein BGX31_008307 [Mortierella sp. GBA43]|nr:hypothetical protein BGX31_008307 [Mortierella sp. GBA43]
MTLSVPGLSVYLTAYDLSKDAFARRFPYLSSDSVLNHMASAVVAEVSSGLFWTPMEVLKSKQQVENLSRPKSKSAYAQWSRRPISTQQLAKKIFDREGLLGFYRGYFITLGVFVPYSMIYFATYEQLKDMAWRQQGHLMGPRMAEAATAEEEVAAADRQQEDTLPFLTIMSCAAVAAGIAGGVSNVVDVVKTRWQISVLATTEENSSTRRIIQHMISQGGLSSFTRGMGARILWMIPSVTISMSVFEWLKAHGFT